MQDTSRRDVLKLVAGGVALAAGSIALAQSAAAVPLPAGIEVDARKDSLVEDVRWRWPWSRRRRRYNYYPRRRRRWWW